MQILITIPDAIDREDQIKLAVVNAVMADKPVRFTYMDRKGRWSRRHATFLAIEKCKNGSTIVRAFDHDRQFPRTFTLENIGSI